MLQIVILLCKHPDILLILNCSDHDPRINMGTQEGLKKFIIEICRENLFKVILRTTICDILLYRYPDVLLIQFCCNYDCQNISRALEWIKKPTYTEKNLFSIATIYDITLQIFQFSLHSNFLKL